MYGVNLKGINIRDNDRIVKDGFLQESINMQWRDGAYRPIPERLLTTIGSTLTGNYLDFIFHKVSDENTINVLGLRVDGPLLNWVGVIEDGVYTEFGVVINIPIPNANPNNVSFTILNGLIYFMSSVDEFYYRVQYNETDDAYEEKDMYAWKDLIPFYPENRSLSIDIPLTGRSNYLISTCGFILIRYSLVLKTGEEVLHSPIYPFTIMGINYGATAPAKDDLITNIHTIINTNLEFINPTILNDEISAINIYATVPKYATNLNDDYNAPFTLLNVYNVNDAKSIVSESAEEPFYLIKTIDAPGTSVTDKSLLLYIGDLDFDFNFNSYDEIKIDMSTIAAGSVMPIDNFTYHKLYGTIKSNNGRLIIDKPKTILSDGHIRALAIDNSTSKTGYHIDTEDGNLIGVAYQIDKSPLGIGSFKVYRGLLSYPDSRATYSGSDTTLATEVFLYKSRGNKAHNIACAFEFSSLSDIGGGSASDDGSTITFLLTYSNRIYYEDADITTPSDPAVVDSKFYSSENRLQFGEVGEFSVWPAINSYRVGEGKILFVGDNSVDPANADYIAPLLIGTSDGIYTVNFDATGVTFIQSITKAANMPALSSENIQIDQNLIYVSDKGLVAINNGRLTNLTVGYFPDSGNGVLPFAVNPVAFNLAGFLVGAQNQESVLPNYNILTQDFLGTGNIYTLDDIIEYMKGSLFAYDGRRDNLWCCNPRYVFSLIFNFKTKQWDMSSYVFDKVYDFYSTLSTEEGDVYSRFIVRSEDGNINILSGEDSSSEVEVHLLTRPIKMRYPDTFKKIERFISRCELYKNSEDAYMNFGMWGKQEMNKNKEQIPLVAYSDNINAFPNDVRQDIPIGRQRGKYKTVSVLLEARCLPESSIDSFNIVAIPVNNKILR